MKWTQQLKRIPRDYSWICIYAYFTIHLTTLCIKPLQKNIYITALQFLLIIPAYINIDTRYKDQVLYSISRRVIKYHALCLLYYHVYPHLHLILPVYIYFTCTIVVIIDFGRIFFYEYMRNAYYKKIITDHQRSLLVFYFVVVKNEVAQKYFCLSKFDKMINCFMDDSAGLENINGKDVFLLFCGKEKMRKGNGYAMGNDNSDDVLKTSAIQPGNEQANINLDLTIENKNEVSISTNDHDLTTNNMNVSILENSGASNNHDLTTNNFDASILESSSSTNDHDLITNNMNMSILENSEAINDYDLTTINKSIADKLESSTSTNDHDIEESINERGEDLTETNIKDYKITRDSVNDRCGKLIGTCIFTLFDTFLELEIKYDVFNENYNQVIKEIKSLKNTLIHSQKLFSILNIVLIGLQFIIILMFILDASGISFKFTSMFLSLILFTFYPSAKQVIEAFIFLLINHPFDCGDRIYLNGENMLVKKMQFFCTIFDKWNGEMVIINNQTLSHSNIDNIRRSKQQKHILNFLINTKDIEKMLCIEILLKKSIKNHPKFKKVVFAIDQISHSTHVLFKIIIEHNSNFQNGFFMWRAHTYILKIFKKILCDNDIEYFPIEEKWNIISN